MKLGVCTGIDNIEKAAKIGFDYIEIALNWLGTLEDAEYEKVAAKKASWPIPVLKCNCLLPGTIPVTGPDVDEAVIRAYLDKAFCRAASIGVETVVFGSGASRSVPAGWDFSDAWKQVIWFLQIASEYCDKYALTLVIEPLRMKECNIVNLVSEGLLLASVVDHPRICVLGDTHHMVSGSETFDAFTHAGKKLQHVHIGHTLADHSGRIYPSAEHFTPCDEALKALKDMHYGADVSIEANCEDFEKDGQAAFDALKPYFA